MHVDLIMIKKRDHHNHAAQSRDHMPRQTLSTSLIGRRRQMARALNLCQQLHC